MQVSEDVFDHADNLFVFFFDDAEDLSRRRGEIEGVKRALKAEEKLHRLRYYFNVRKEGDPPMPEGVGPSEGADGQPPLRVVMYKGQRKTVIRFCPKDVPREGIIGFFTPVSEELPKSASLEPAPRITGAAFAEDVLKGSSPERPVLLQMYEDTCFLCFLMRPFINSVAKLFEANGVPLTIKRLNLERNDFPDKCPVARGTPTFVLFRGPGVQPMKLEEFRPKEICERISREFPASTEPIFERMDELQGLVSKRFHLFSQVVMWTVELQKLELLYRAGSKVLPTKAGDGDDDFGTVVAAIMGVDMRRTDEIPDNLVHLQRECEEVEHDAIVAGIMLGERVVGREFAEMSM